MQAEEMEVKLAAGEAREVRLQLRPQVPGTLTLRGITWTLSDIARGERIFKPKAATGRPGTRSVAHTHPHPNVLEGTRRQRRPLIFG